MKIFAISFVVFIALAAVNTVHAIECDIVCVAPYQQVLGQLKEKFPEVYDELLPNNKGCAISSSGQNSPEPIEDPGNGSNF